MTNPAHHYHKENEQTVKWLILTLFMLSWSSIKISLPALPRLADVFHTHVANLKLSITLFFICFALSQAVWGSFSEHFGRRPIILIGLMITVLGSIVAACADTVFVYILGRCLEGIGMGSISPVCRAMLADILDKKQAANVMGIVSLTIANMPVLAPLIGGYLVVYFNWRAIFIFFGTLSFIYLIIAWKNLPETIHKRREKLSLKTFVADYYFLMKEPLFWGYTLCYAFLSGFILAYYAAMPFWFVSHFKMLENHYAYLALFNVAAYTAGILSSRELLNIYEMNALIKLATRFGLLAACFALVSAFLFASSITMVVLLMAIFTFAGGAIFPNVTAGSLITYKNIAGPVSAFMTTIMFLVAGVASFISTNLSVVTLWPLALFITAGAVGCWLSAHFLLLNK